MLYLLSTDLNAKYADKTRGKTEKKLNLLTLFGHFDDEISKLTFFNFAKNFSTF